MARTTAPPKPPSDRTGIGGNLPPDMDEATFLAAMRKQDEFDEARDAMNKAEGRFRKDMKTRGVKLKIFDAVRSLRDMERKDIVADTLERFKYLRWLKLPLGKQVDLFPKEAEPVTEDKAYLSGYQAGIKGKGVGSPPDEFKSGKQQQAWMQGWNDGQKKMAFDVFDKKDYYDDTADDENETKGEEPEEGEVEPGEAEEGAGEVKTNVVALGQAMKDKADKAKEKAAAEPAAKPPPGPPAAPKSTTDETIARVAAKKKADKAAKAEADKPKPAPEPAPAKPKPTKAAEQAAGGGVGGMAPAGARKGGGDFDDNGDPITPPAAAAAPENEDDDDLDVDLELGDGDEDEDEDSDLELEDDED